MPYSCKLSSKERSHECRAHHLQASSIVRVSPTATLLCIQKIVLQQVQSWREGNQDLVTPVGSIVQSVLGSLPGADVPLMEAGLDSLGAVELRNALGFHFNLPDLPATLTYDYTTIEALADHISGATQFLPAKCCHMHRFKVGQFVTERFTTMRLSWC